MLHAKYLCIPVSGLLEEIFKIYQNFTYFASYWALKGTSPFI